MRENLLKIAEKYKDDIEKLYPDCIFAYNSITKSLIIMQRDDEAGNYPLEIDINHKGEVKIISLYGDEDKQAAIQDIVDKIATVLEEEK